MSGTPRQSTGPRKAILACSRKIKRAAALISATSVVWDRPMGLPFLGGRRLNCRMCASTELVRYLDLGHQPPADQFRTAEQISAEPLILYPLEVYLCETCGLSQLGYVVSPEILYQEDYPYESSTTASGRAHFAAFASSVVEAFALASAQLVVDIGSNVGFLLAGFAQHGIRIRGADP